MDKETLESMYVQQPGSKDFFEKADIDNRKLNVHGTTPCIEISQFALNDLYLDILKNEFGKSNGVGQWIYDTFIMPVVVRLTRIIGATLLTLFAYKDDEGKVIEAYKNMGFATIEEDDLEYFPTTANLQPLLTYSEKSCIFMFQTTQDICSKIQ